MDVQNLFGQMQQLQAKLREAQAGLDAVTASAESGAGMVKATVNGRRLVVELEIDPSLLNKEDQEMLQDLVIAAVNKATGAAEAAAAEHMKTATAGLMPPIPGLDLSKFV